MSTATTGETKDDAPKGFTCTKCKKEHVFAHYVFAHWRDVLVHTCECGAKHEIFMGHAEPMP